MSISHIAFNDQSQHGRMIRRSLQQLEEGTETLNDVIAAMQSMIDGDGSISDQFAEVADKFGMSTNTLAKAAWDELNSLKYKLSTDASVDNVNAALLQAFAKFR